MPLMTIRSFMKHEASAGLCLMAAAVLAMICANSPLESWYNQLLETHFNMGFENANGTPFSAFTLDKSILHWVNDGLMALFFFFVGLEIKREISIGQLSSRRRITLPALAALGGMVVPAAVFYFINIDHPDNMRGWAIPAATDIAFALGVIALLGSRVPTPVKVLLTAVAIIDDIGAILIIALFYTSRLSLESLFAALLGIIILGALNSFKVKRTGPYILIGIFIWICVLKSGIHATLAGVVVSFFIPLYGKDGLNDSPLEKLEHALQPWIAFLILPLFGFANAGVPFGQVEMSELFNPLTVGIVAGLVVGKQVGIFTMIYAAVKMGWARKPKGTSWGQLYALSIMCGIGFTMSLFIGKLAFTTMTNVNYVRVGVLAGSLISAVLGYAIFYFISSSNNSKLITNESDTIT